MLTLEPADVTLAGAALEAVAVDGSSEAWQAMADATAERGEGLIYCVGLLAWLVLTTDGMELEPFEDLITGDDASRLLMMVEAAAPVLGRALASGELAHGQLAGMLLTDLVARRSM